MLVPEPAVEPLPESWFDLHAVREDYLAGFLIIFQVSFCTLFVSLGPDGWVFPACLAALVSPLGVLLRWQLSFQNPRHAWLPLGTLAANLLACLFDAVVQKITARSPHARLGAAMLAGFGGGLSTVSTVAAETAALLSDSGKRHRAYTYVFLTSAAGFGLGMACYKAA